MRAVKQYLRGQATGDAAEMHFVLLKVDGAWKIANKVCAARPTK